MWVRFETQPSAESGQGSEEKHVVMVPNPEDKPVKDIRGEDGRRLEPAQVVYSGGVGGIGRAVRLVFDAPVDGEVAL